jgi:hypothetical protein
MNPTRTSRRILVAGGLLLVLGLVGHTLPTEQPELPLRIFYDNAGGAVLFPHDGHQDMGQGCSQCHHDMLTESVAATCVSCHHLESFEIVEWEDEDLLEVHTDLAENDDDPASCLGCHTHSELIVPVAAASRTGCSECHDLEDTPSIQSGHNCSACHAVAEERPALACRTCHGTGEGEDATCESCHPGEGYDSDTLEHEDLTSLDEHSCTGCHVASRASDAIHGSCSRCHEDVEHGTFFARSKESAETVCNTCHMK